MGKIVETLINRFDGGISKDKRDGWVQNGSFFTTNKFGVTKNFDALTFPKRLVPYFETVADNFTPSAGFLGKITKFLYAPYETSDSKLYGFGGYTGGGQTDGGFVYVHNASVITNGWDETICGGSVLGGRDHNVFFYYKDYLYWWASGKLVSFDTKTVGNHNIASYQDIAWSTVAQPVHHPADDCAYFFADNDVHRLNGTSFDGGTTTPVLVLPPDMKIVSACAYGNYLAIGCVSTQSYNKKNWVFLWDRDSSITTLTGRIDFGDGELKHLVCLNNKLIGIMSFWQYSAAEISLNRAKILIKQASGDFAVTLNEIITDDDVSVTEDLPGNIYVANNKAYFAAKAPLSGDNRQGIWVLDEFGRVTLDFVEESATSYEGIYRVGNMWFVSHSDGSVNRSVSTLVASPYDFTGIYESLIFTAGDSDLKKKLLGATVTFEKLPAAGQVVLKYRKDGDTSWTTLYTYTTDDALSHGTVNVESSGATLPEYKELELRVESTGGAVITGLKFKSEIIDRQLF